MTTARIVELEEDVSPNTANRPLIFIATPAYGCMLTVQYLQSLLQSQLALTSAGYGLMIDMIGNESLITRARNILTKKFLQSPATHLLFIDADISWTPDAIFRLVQKNEGIVTTSYPKKYLDWTRVEKSIGVSGEPIQQAGLDFNLNVTEPQVEVKNGFAKVLDAATGFMLVKREVIEKMYRSYEKELLVKNDLLGAQSIIPDYVAIFDCMIDPETRRPLSEDFAFSRRWQQMGGDVYMDLITQLGHTGSYHFEGSFKDRVEHGKARTKMPGCFPLDDENIKSIDGKRVVLLAAIVKHTVSLGFVLSMTQILAALQKENKYTVQVKVFDSRDSACDHVYEYSVYSSLVLLNSDLSFQPELILDMLSSQSPFEVGVYPSEDKIDWQQVVTPSKEPIAKRGLEYGVHLLHDGSARSEALFAPLGLAKLDRCVLERVKERLDNRATYCSGKRRLWFHDGVFEDRKVESEEMFCRLWGEGITLNTKHDVVRLGILTFSGVVLARQQIR